MLRATLAAIALAAMLSYEPARTPAPATTTHYSWQLDAGEGWTRIDHDLGVDELDVQIDVPQHSPLAPPLQWIRVELSWEYAWLWRVDTRPGEGEWTAHLPAATNRADGQVWLEGVDQLQGDAPILLESSGQVHYILDPWDPQGSIYEPTLTGPCGQSVHLASVHGFGIGNGATWTGSPEVAAAMTGYSTARLRVLARRQHLAELSGCSSLRSRLLGSLGATGPGTTWRPTLTVTYHY